MNIIFNEGLSDELIEDEIASDENINIEQIEKGDDE